MYNAGGAPHTGELESMLGNIQSEVSKHGVTTKTKGLCGACNQPVIGQVGPKMERLLTLKGRMEHLISP